MQHNAFGRFGGLSAIVAVAVSLAGLVTFFSGAGSGDNSTVDAALKNTSDLARAETGGVLLIVGMSLMIAFSVWLALRYGRQSGLVSTGAAIFSLGALTHFIENVFVLGLYGTSLPAIKAGAAPDTATAATLHITSTASQIAFGFLGAGVLLASLGFLLELKAPRWLTTWGIVAGAGELISAFVGVPFAEPLLLAWLVAVGIRAAGAHDQSPRVT